MMKKYTIVILVFLALISVPLFLQIRSSQRSKSQSVDPNASHPPMGMGQTLAYSGKVVETMNAGGYTYVRVDTGEDEIWAAGPETIIAVGDPVSFAPGMRMTDFHSETLDRSFDEILFVPELLTGEHAMHAPSGHPPVTSTNLDDVDFSGVQVPSGGKSIGDVYAGRSRLAGKKVIVCGKVVKFTPGVMGKNWVHLRDGTGKDGENDLAVTTDATVRTGDIVVVTGELGIDKDFGFGYVYDVIVEDAVVTVEQ